MAAITWSRLLPLRLAFFCWMCSAIRVKTASHPPFRASGEKRSDSETVWYPPSGSASPGKHSKYSFNTAPDRAAHAYCTQRPLFPFNEARNSRYAFPALPPYPFFSASITSETRASGSAGESSSCG